MSLDVTLYDLEMVEVFEFNITHNLARMAQAAGVYQAMWHPEELGIEVAEDLVPLLEMGLYLLIGDPARFEPLNPENGWGDYADLLRTVRRYLAACKDHPNAAIEVCR